MGRLLTGPAFRYCGRMPRYGANTLEDLPAGVRMVDLVCTRCERHGRLRVDRLIAEHGAGAGLPDVAFAIAKAAGCPRFDDVIWRRCDVYFTWEGKQTNG